MTDREKREWAEVEEAIINGDFYFFDKDYNKIIDMNKLCDKAEYAYASTEKGLTALNLLYLKNLLNKEFNEHFTTLYNKSKQKLYPFNKINVLYYIDRDCDWTHGVFYANDDKDSYYYIPNMETFAKPLNSEDRAKTIKQYYGYDKIMEFLKEN